MQQITTNPPDLFVLCVQGPAGLLSASCAPLWDLFEIEPLATPEQQPQSNEESNNNE